MRYFIGDQPTEPLALVPSRADEPVSLTGVAPTVTVEGVELDADIQDDMVIADWPAESAFLEEGLYRIVLVLTSPDGIETFDFDPIVVEDPTTGWHTLTTARGSWASSTTDVQLYELLSIARHQVLEYAPALPDDAALPPIRYRQAQLSQARNILNSNRVNPNGGEGIDTYALTPFPLDYHVKALLRPRRAVPTVG